MKKLLPIHAALALAAVLLGACAGSPSPGAGRARGVYVTSGRSIRMVEAMNQCTVEALKLAVVDLIGEEWAEKEQPRLVEVVYGARDPNVFIFQDESETTRRDKQGEEYIYERRIVVDMETLERTLKANNLMPPSSAAAQVAQREGASSGGAAGAVRDASGASATGGSGAASSASGSSGTGGSGAGGTPAPSGPTAEDQRIIRAYVEKLTYLVYFNEEGAPDPFAAKVAVGVANEYLVSQRKEVVDSEQVQKLKKDQLSVYEEQAGGEISLIQWIAQKLDADVYVEIDARATAETAGSGSSSRHYAQANVTMKAYESSSGRLLGNQSWNSPRTTSLSSRDDATLNALQASVYKLMPLVTDQCKASLLEEALEQGIKYELVVLHTEDTRLMNDFRRKLVSRVKDAQTVSQSAEQAKYDVWLYGSMDDLVDAVFDVADTLPGLEGIELVVQRRKSVTFDTGQ